MKILFIIDETPFFHPDYLDKVIKNLKNDEILVGITKNIPRKSNLNFQLLKKSFLLEFDEILSLILKKISYTLLNLIFPKGTRKKNFSVEGVCKKITTTPKSNLDLELDFFILGRKPNVNILDIWSLINVINK